MPESFGNEYVLGDGKRWEEIHEKEKNSGISNITVYS